jgi:hypothetical protein
MEHAGGCHCGNIHVLLRLSKPPDTSSCGDEGVTAGGGDCGGDNQVEEASAAGAV